jgi:hypothetical protein
MRLLILFKPPTHCENADEAPKSEPKNKKFRSNLGRPRIAFPLVSRLHQETTMPQMPSADSPSASRVPNNQRTREIANNSVVAGGNNVDP